MQHLACLIFLAVLGLSVPNHQDITSYHIYADNGLFRGEWGWEDVCFNNNVTHAMEFKFENSIHVDKTAGNALKLYCADDDETSSVTVTSIEGRYGRWQGLRSCPYGHYLMGFRLKVLNEQGVLADDSGVENIQMECSDGTILDGIKSSAQVSKMADDQVVDLDQEPSERAMFAKWGSWARCAEGHGVLGLLTRVEQGQLFEDDAGLTDVTLICAMA